MGGEGLEKHAYEDEAITTRLGRLASSHLRPPRAGHSMCRGRGLQFHRPPRWCIGASMATCPPRPVVDGLGSSTLAMRGGGVEGEKNWTQEGEGVRGGRQGMCEVRVASGEGEASSPPTLLATRHSRIAFAISH